MGHRGRTQPVGPDRGGHRLQHLVGQAEDLEGEDGGRAHHLFQIATGTEALQVGHVGRRGRGIGPDDHVALVVHVETWLDAVAGEVLEHRLGHRGIEDTAVKGRVAGRVPSQGAVQQHQGSESP